jgi:glucose/arabinose dehydrogenase
MNRSSLLASAALICSLACAPAALAQTAKSQAQAAKATPATTTTPTPTTPARAKFVPVVKGLASIEVIKGTPKRVGGDIVTVLKVKNTSSGAIALLRVDELWYNQKREQVTGDSEKVLKPIQPGEIVEITMKSPSKPDLYINQYAFSHVNGKVDVKSVKKFSE